MTAAGLMDVLNSEKGIQDTLTEFIIRPPRSGYKVADLGPAVFRLPSGLDDPVGAPQRAFARRDMELYNMRGMKLMCSWYVPREFDTAPESVRPLPCVIYCHGNSGSRYDAMEAVFLLSMGFSLFTFDFCGCGMSEGKYVSLGVFEQQDLAAVVDYLKLQKKFVSTIAIWGRSMGAVTAIMYASKDPTISCLVCDSAFSSLTVLIRDLVAAKVSRHVPSFIINAAMGAISKNVERLANFRVEELETTRYAASCAVPAFLLHGTEDDFVQPKHCLALADWWKPSVVCVQHMVEGGHNSYRDAAHNIISNFLKVYLSVKPEHELPQQHATFQSTDSATTVNTAASAGSPSSFGSPSSVESTAGGAAVLRNPSVPLSSP